MKFNLIVFLIAGGLSFYSCSKIEKSKEVLLQVDGSEWIEMDSFHIIMSEAFYPYKDSANLEPAKRLAGEIAREAEAWSVTSLPEKVNTDEMRALLNQLKKDSRDLSEMIKGGASDDEIAANIHSLHDSFHVIMEMWSGDKHEQ